MDARNVAEEPKVLGKTQGEKARNCRFHRRLGRMKRHVNVLEDLKTAEKIKIIYLLPHIFKIFRLCYSMQVTQCS